LGSPEVNQNDATTAPAVTEPYRRFSRYSYELTRFVGFFTWSVKRADQYTEVIASLGVPDSGVEEHVGEAAREQRKYVRLILELLLSRGTDNFLTYIAELLAVVFTARPETLRSSETVKVEDVLRHQTMDELLHSLAERKVEKLSYQGVRDLQQDLIDKLGFQLFLSASDLTRAVRIIEMRNLVAHNRGVVNSVFKRRTGDSSATVGQRLKLDAKAVFSDLEFLSGLAKDIDHRAALKWGLARTCDASADHESSADT
jgi:hypothetical protein